MHRTKYKINYIKQYGGNNIIYRAETKEAFNDVYYLIRRLDWYKEKGYNIRLPTNKKFIDIYKNKQFLTQTDVEQMRQIFYDEIYKEHELDDAIQIVSQSRSKVEDALILLAQLKKNWNFEIKPVYNIILTQYGPGGGYDSRTGHITILIDPLKIKQSYINQITKTIIHEIVHIGIENDIIQEYDLTHEEKETLVDLICILYLHLPKYEIQYKTNEIIKFVTYDDIVNNLPRAIELYKQKN